jgi:hypothetical protein
MHSQEQYEKPLHVALTSGESAACEIQTQRPLAAAVIGPFAEPLTCCSCCCCFLNNLWVLLLLLLYIYHERLCLKRQGIA